MDDQRDYAEEAANRADMVREGQQEIAEEIEQSLRATCAVIAATARVVTDAVLGSN